MPMYWADYFGDTMHLTTFQHGCYLLLIGAYWRRGGPLPNDFKYLAQICRTSCDKLARYGNPVIALFTSKDGLLVHKRLEKEILKSSNRLSSARAAGRAGGQASHSHSHNNSKKESSSEATPAIRVLEVMGVRNDPNWHGDAGRVTAWINDGADLELDILPTIQRLMTKRNGQGPPRSLRYFDGAIADARATRLQPLPHGTPRGNGNGHSTGPITALHRAGEKVLAVREERRRREAAVSGDAVKPLLASK